MVVSIIIAVLAAATLPFWIRMSYRLLREAQTTEATAAAYERGFERTPLRDTGSLNWRSPEGETASVPMKGVNISRSGALVETRGELPLGRVVLIHFGSLRTMTTATVRHCTPCGSQFRIGLEFRHPLMTAQRGTWEVAVQAAT